MLLHLKTFFECCLYTNISITNVKNIWQSIFFFEKNELYLIIKSNKLFILITLYTL